MFTKICNFQQVKSLTVIQLTTSFQNTAEYISGPAAIQKNLISVKETSDAGDVNQLHVINTSSSFVFFMDGDILAGAKQNRVLNTSVYLHPQSKCTLPVSCVEQGRWHHKSKAFTNTDYSAPSQMRAKKAVNVRENLMHGERFDANQGEVWSDVRKYSASMGVNSPTSNLSDVFDSKGKDFDSFLSGFNSDSSANGLAIFIGKKLLNIDVFNRSDIYSEYFPKLIRGAAMDAFNLTAEQNVAKAEAEYKTLEFLDKFEQLEFQSHQGVAAGNEKRFETKELTGFELSYLNTPIHLTALSLS